MSSEHPRYQSLACRGWGGRQPNHRRAHDDCVGSRPLIRAGDRARAVCPRCGSDTEISFKEHPIEYDHPTLGMIPVPDHLVGICTSCGQIPVIPSEGTAALVEAIRKASQE